MTDGISLNELARRLGRAKSGLHKLAATRQIPRLPSGKFDETAVRAALVSNVDPARQKPAPTVHSTTVHPRRTRKVNSAKVNIRPVPPIKTEADAKDAVALIAAVLQAEGVEAGPIDFSAARTADTILKARDRDLRIQERRKTLVPLAAVKEHVSKAFVGYRKAVQAMPSRYAAEMAAKLGCDPAALDAELQQMIHATLSEMSAPVLRSP